MVNKPNPANICVSNAGLTAGTTTTYSTGGAVIVSIQGKTVTCAQKTNAATPQTDFNTGQAFIPVRKRQGSVFVFGVTATDTIGVVQGSVVDVSAGNSDVSTWINGLPQFPSIPDNFTPIGYVVLKVGDNYGAESWVMGSSNLASTTGVTRTFTSVLMLPERPQAS